MYQMIYKPWLSGTCSSLNFWKSIIVTHHNKLKEKIWSYKYTQQKHLIKSKPHLWLKTTRNIRIRGEIPQIDKEHVQKVPYS